MIKKVHLSSRLLIVGFCLAALAILQTVSPVSHAQQQDPTAADTVQAAWDLAKEAAAYDYTSNVRQTTYPAPAVQNVGRPPRIDTFTITGFYDQIAEKMELEMRNQHDEQVEMVVHGTDTKGRTTQTAEWEDLGTVNDFFAPGGDPLGFLAGATDIEKASGDESSPLSHYTFSFSGHAFGRFITDALTREMIANGEVMPDTRLDVTEAYRRMIGSGEIAIDEQGYPTHIRLDLDLGSQEGGEQIIATLEMYYSDYQQDVVNPTAVWFTPAGFGSALLDISAQNPALPNYLAISFAFLLFSLALALLIWHTWHTQTFYKAVAGSITILMLAGPFLHIGSAQAYHGRLAPRLEREDETQERTAEETAAQMVGEYQTAQEWNPQQNPLLGAKDSEAMPEIMVELDPLASTSAIASTTVTSTVDTDSDGVTDAIEESLELCAGPSGTYCTGVTDTTDSDGDGLSDGDEVNQLGTFGDRADSDNDGIADNLEVAGFSYNGTQWYLDPREQDTNKDGLTDAAECPIWIPTNPSYNPAGICPDTNGNGTPDIFDHDNDGDGVPDGQDLSPHLASDSLVPFDRNNPFKLQIDNLEVDKPVLVSLQLRPSNGENLYHMGDVVDWPSPDVTGQIQRRFSTTFATTSNTDIRDTNSFNADYGDVRIVPLLEIQMPVSATHYANLPVKAGVPADRPNGYTTTQWLDDSQTQPYGITVFDSSSDGTLSAYLPLNADSDASGGGRVAFSTQMYYQPSQGTATVADWGAAHEYRLVWMVQMITETCTDPTNNSTCTEKISVVHIYDDEWTLTGMNIREEHGTSVAVMYENPATDNDHAMENSLWEASFNLGNTFLRARDCATMTGNNCNSDNIRDVRVADIPTFVSTYDSAQEPITTETFNYPHVGFISHIMMTETKRILTTHFQPYAGQMNPTILFAHEQDLRAYNLDDMVFAGNQVTADMTTSNAPRQIMGGLSWGPYRYNSTAAAWESADLIEYVSGLESRLQSLTYFQPTTTALADQHEAMGRIRWVQSYYLTLARGLNSILEVDGTPMWGQSNFYPEAEYGGKLPNATFTGAIFLAYYSLLGVVNTFQSVANGTRFVSAFLQEMGRAYGALSSGGFGNVNRWVNLTRMQKVFVNITNVAMGVTALAAIAGIAILAVSFATGDTQLQTVAVLLLNSATVLVASSIIVSNVIFLVSLRQLSAQGNISKLIQVASKGPVKAITALGVVFQFIVIWGAFFWSVRNVSPGTIQYDLNLANAIAQTIVAVLIIALGALVYTIILFLAVAAPGIGSLVVMAIYLIDALVYLVTYFLSEVFGIGKPTSVIQELTQAIAEALYDVDLVIPNLGPSGRLDFYPHIALHDEQAGFTVGNSITVTMDITNTPTYNGDFSFDMANNSAFRYALERTDTPDPATHSGLAVGSIDAQWQNLGNNQMRYTDTISTVIPFSDLGTGRDQNLDSQLYLIEGLAVQYAGCWQAVVTELCTLETINESIPLNVGSAQIFDILPNTISEFRTMGWLGNGNSSGQTSLSASVTPADFDNDRVHASIDLNDTKWDTDGDGLGDYFERAKGTNLGAADSDNDGLLDADEFREGTDPNKADTDGDGLNDYIETVEGWLIAYDGGLTRIWSNPLVADFDNDKLSDLEEYMFGFNPYIHTDPSLVDSLIQFDNFDVIESNAPVLYLPFDETTTTGAFADLSGNGQQVTCNQASGFCPVAGVDGRYGNAIQLDGTNDFVEVTHDAAFNFDTDEDFTVAMWVKPDLVQNNLDSSLYEMWGNGQASYPFVLRYNGATGAVYGARYDGANNPAVFGSIPINDGQFHHIAFSRLNGTLYLYVDGVLDSSIADSTTGTAANSSSVFIGNRETAYHFTGVVDDYLIYPHGMTAVQVQQVQAGSYNLNDLVFNPGEPFTYQSVVTNTNPARHAEGVLLANSTYVSPTLSQPLAFLPFEIDPERTGWDNLGTVMTCDLATCPTLDLNAAVFDGVDDFYSIPALEQSVYDNTGIRFDLYLDRALAVGEKMYILDSILPPDADYDPNKNYVDIYVEYESATTARLVIEAQYTDFDPAITAASYSGVPIGSWYQVNYHRGQGINPQKMLIGPGAIGNDLTGTYPLEGKLDNLEFYMQTYSQAYIGAPLVAIYPRQLEADFDYYQDVYYSTPGASDLGQSVADCKSATTTCPEFARTGGRYDGGIQFTTIFTEEIKLSNLDLSGDFTIAGWFNSSTGGGMFLNSYADGADYLAGTNPGFFMNVINTGAQLQTQVNTGGTNHTLSSPFTSGWNHVALVRKATAVELYLNGVLVDSANIVWNLSNAGTIRLGNLTDSFPYYGRADDIAVFNAALDLTEIEVIAKGKYPAVAINAPYVNFSVPAGTTQTPSGTGQTAVEAPASAHRFNQIADVAFDTTLPSYSIADQGISGVGNLRIYPFDELPGYVGPFEYVPSVGNSIIPDSGYVRFLCDTAATCPTSGVQGVDRRSVYFDGKDDLIYFNTTYPYGANGISLWVKGERGTFLSGQDLSNGSSFALNMDGLSMVSSNGCAFNIPYDLPSNQWVHVTIGGYDKTMNYYVNGQLAATQTSSYPYNCGDLSGINFIGSDMDSTDPFKGHIDDLRFYESGLSGAATQAADVQALYEKSGPLFRFGFDEESFDTAFVDSSGRDRTGVPTQQTQVVSGTSVTVPNPAFGTDGKIGNIAAFNGDGVITVEDPDYDIGNLTHDFTVMAWIKPTNLAGESGFRTILSPSADTSVNGWLFGTLQKKLTLSMFNVATHQSTADVNEDLWQHVALTMDSSNNVTFYLNGVPAGSSNYGAAVANSDEPLYIGGRMDAGQIIQAFEGGIDELVVYGRTLNQSEVTRDFLTGLRWYRDRGSRTLTIDTDNPTINLVTSQSYFTNTFTMLAVETFDPTSRVSLLDFGVKGPSDSAFSWQGASPCVDGALGRMWCPAFNPATMGGEGRYEVQFRAVDAVGNETTSPISTIYIDTTAPTATSSHSGEWGTLTPINGRSNSWTVPLAGTVSDGTIHGGFAGSGVVSSTVLIALRDSNGRLLSDNRQQATVSSTNWNITFNILSELPSDTYTIELQAQDAVGNLADLTNVGTIRLDGVAPTATVDTTLSPKFISSTIVTPVQGTVDDPSGRGVQSVEVMLNQPAVPTGRSTIGTWQPATVSGSDWSYSVPSNLNGFFELDLRTTDVEGNTAEKGTQWRGLIDNIPPTVYALAYHTGGSGEPRTVYSVLYLDFYLDESSLVHPCGPNDAFNRLTHDTLGLPSDGLVNSVNYICEVAGYETAPRDFTICDGAGNCTTSTVIHYGHPHTLDLSVDGGNHGTLGWDQPLSCFYLLYSNPTPYFIGQTPLATVTNGANNYLLGQMPTAQNQYYQMYAYNCADGTSAVSNEVGVFSFALTPGQ